MSQKDEFTRSSDGPLHGTSKYWPIGAQDNEIAVSRLSFGMIFKYLQNG
jgi:hypothetical protein